MTSLSRFEENHLVIDWYSENQRNLPWRNSTPWGVVVSEFMLQQTPVIRVLPKWNEWMERWQTPEALSEATTSEVITAWGRLGYPRRALRLHESSKIIARDFSGAVPNSIEELRKFPGVGEYTAAAIAAFAFEESVLVLDINIRRFFSRAIDGAESPSTHITHEERKVRSELIPKVDGHLWAAATMELGALICTSRSPRCDFCPVRDRCKWRANEYPESVLVKKRQGWHGSDRKCRGTIIQALRERPSLMESELKKLWDNDSQVEKAIQTLLIDGLISKTEFESYSLP